MVLIGSDLSPRSPVDHVNLHLFFLPVMSIFMIFVINALLFPFAALEVLSHPSE